MRVRRRLIVCVMLTAFLAVNGAWTQCCPREGRFALPSPVQVNTPPDDADDHSDPCPHSHDDSSCPCPGGCASCNVAKVLCSVAAVLPPEPASGLERSLADLTPLYTPPYSGKLNRPPRL